MPSIHLRGHVLPGGELRDVYVVDGHITFEEPPGGAETVVERGWLTPGLVDAHAHLALHSPAGDDAASPERVRASAHAHLDAGVLLVREPGSLDHESVGLGPDEGLPQVVTAGRFLAPPGRYFPGLAREVSPADLEAAVTEEANTSGAWVKLIGDFFEPGGVIEPNWTAAEFRLAADAAHRAGARITVHATCEDATVRAIDAGFDAIEHGTRLSRDAAVAMGERGITFVPTMAITAALREVTAVLHPDEYAKILRALDDQPALVAAAASAGVRLLAGTDAGMVPHGIVATEIASFLEAGVAPDVALGAGSWAAREYLGYPGIEEGAPADIVVFAEDPRADAAQLTRPLLVMLHGTVVKR